jgi:hypothetical protein
MSLVGLRSFGFWGFWGFVGSPFLGGLVWLFPCILRVYLGASYAFFIKFYYLKKKIPVIRSRNSAEYKFFQV